MKLLVPIQKLPDRPSHLIRAALLDAAECERDPRYCVEDPNGFWNRAWHLLATDRKRCLVCLAGAVMAKSLYVSWGDSYSPEDFEPDTKKKLMALNEFRRGDIHRALVYVLELPKNPLEVERRITPYAQNRRQFYRQMSALADDLEEHAL
jgi:hypothetical protein